MYNKSTYVWKWTYSENMREGGGLLYIYVME